MSEKSKPASNQEGILTKSTLATFGNTQSKHLDNYASDTRQHLHRCLEECQLDFPLSPCYSFRGSFLLLDLTNRVSLVSIVDAKAGKKPLVNCLCC